MCVYVYVCICVYVRACVSLCVCVGGRGEEKEEGDKVPVVVVQKKNPNLSWNYVFSERIWLSQRQCSLGLVVVFIGFLPQLGQRLFAFISLMCIRVSACFPRFPATTTM